MSREQKGLKDGLGRLRVRMKKEAKCPFPTLHKGLAKNTKWTCPNCKVEWFVGLHLGNLIWLTSYWKAKPCS